MNWNDQAIVLSARKHGETSAIVTMLSREHGVHAGMVRGGAAKRWRGVLQPGNHLVAEWRARLASHLGTFKCEMSHAFAAAMLNDPLKLAGLSSACAVAQSTLCERQPHPEIYLGLLDILIAMEEGENRSWTSLYVKWELNLLAEVGFGLDLGECVATGSNDELAYVSPKSGRAVSLSAGEPYRNSLLALPQFLLEEGGEGDLSEVAAGMKLTGYFLNRHVFSQSSGPGPSARQRLVARLRG